eukprot:m.79904 g.79904  ORF g.79904 m.79904 type:complete len:498 (+) comp25260_c0_seq1:378-1871(+)
MEVSTNSVRLRRTLAGLVGNVIEWYDFSIFASVSDVLAEKFFQGSSTSHETKRIFTFIIFGTGFVFRPLGAIVFGYLGDTRGRRFSLIVSVLVMSIATILTGSLPTQGSGPWEIENGAIAMLVIVRIIQGVSVGGELIGTVVYTTETAPGAKWGFYGALPFSTICLGVVLGLIVQAVLRESLGKKGFEDYGWRICFWFGGAMGTLAFFARKWMDETSLFNETEKLKNPFKAAVTTHRSVMLVVALTSGMLSTIFYIYFIWVQTLLSVHLGVSYLNSSIVIAVNLLLTAILLPLFGHLSDTKGRTEVMMFGGIGGILLSVPVLALVVYVEHATTKTVVSAFAIALMSVVFSAWGGPMPAWFVEGVPADARYSAIAIGYNVGVALAGSVSLVVGEILFEQNPLAPAIYVTIISLVATVVVYKYSHSETYGAVKMTRNPYATLKLKRATYSSKIKRPTYAHLHEKEMDPYLDTISLANHTDGDVLMPSDLQSDYQLYDGF